MRLLTLLFILAPAVSFAQGYGPPGLPPPPPPPGGVAPGYGYGVVNPWAFHRGVTFEANLGVGWIHESASAMGATITNDSDAALAGADISIGGWVNPQLALTV